jgi:hypothetical protein
MCRLQIQWTTSFPKIPYICLEILYIFLYRAQVPTLLKISPVGKFLFIRVMLT